MDDSSGMVTMKIKERIANKIIDWMEENVEGFKEINDEAYYKAEKGIADIIQKEINDWLGYDTDSGDFEKPDRIRVELEKILKPIKARLEKNKKEFAGMIKQGKKRL